MRCDALAFDTGGTVLDWHGSLVDELARVPTWPDFAPALARLRQHVPVVSFTMLPTFLVIDVSRQNGLTWDAIVS